MTAIMKSEPTPSDREVLTGLVERITYQNAENGFCVLRIKARGQRELVTLVGHAAAISACEWITATGNSINDRTQQFKALFLKTSAPATYTFYGAAIVISSPRSARPHAKASRAASPGWVEDATL
jgi:hypothetical protein